MSGKDKARPLWNRYFSDTIALIWVVDSSDHRRFQLCKQELHRVARDPELSKAAVLVYVNKQDLRDGEEGSCITNCTLNECAQMQRKTCGAQKYYGPYCCVVFVRDVSLPGSVFNDKPNIV